jgi:hypothetical protein
MFVSIVIGFFARVFCSSIPVCGSIGTGGTMGISRFFDYKLLLASVASTECAQETYDTPPSVLRSLTRALVAILLTGVV